MSAVYDGYESRSPGGGGGERDGACSNVIESKWGRNGMAAGCVRGGAGGDQRAQDISVEEARGVRNVDGCKG